MVGYFYPVDHAGHLGGPDSKEVKKGILREYHILNSHLI